MNRFWMGRSGLWYEYMPDAVPHLVPKEPSIAVEADQMTCYRSRWDSFLFDAFGDDVLLLCWENSRLVQRATYPWVSRSILLLDRGAFQRAPQDPLLIESEDLEQKLRVDIRLGARAERCNARSPASTVRQRTLGRAWRPAGEGAMNRGPDGVTCRRATTTT